MWSIGTTEMGGASGPQGTIGMGGVARVGVVHKSVVHTIYRGSEEDEQQNGDGPGKMAVQLSQEVTAVANLL